MEEITTVQDLKENLVTLDLRENLVKMEQEEPLENLEEGELMAEEDHLGWLELLDGLEIMASQESPVLQDQEVNLEQSDHQDPKEKKGILDQEVLAGVQGLLEPGEDEGLLVARENQEIQDLKVLKVLLVHVESLVKMEGMGLVQ